jgi:quinol monooxygenase YgiN
MLEAWESEAALAKHLSQPSLQAGLAKLAPMAAGAPSILRLRPV